MVRWGYLLPRLTVAAVVMIALSMLVNPVVHRSVVGASWRFLKLQIQMDSLDASLVNSKLDIQQLAVAHPKLSREKLFEADRFIFDFNTNALWRGRLVVDKAYLTGIQFDMARQAGEGFEFNPVFKSKKKKSDPKAGTNWLKLSKDLVKREVTDKLKSPQLLQQLATDWPPRYHQLRERIDQITTTADRLEEQSRNKGEGAQRVAAIYKMLESVAQLRRQVGDAQQSLATIKGEVGGVRRQVREAIDYDKQVLDQHMPLIKLEPEAWSHKLLGEQMTAYLKRAVQIVAWCNRNLPKGKAIKRPKKQRGEYIDFREGDSAGLLVRQLFLHGEGRLEGEAFEFLGQVRNLSTAPSKVAQPTMINFITKGSLVSKGKMLLDLRGPSPKCRLVMNLPQALTGDHRLELDDWTLAISSKSTELRAVLEFDDEQVNGAIRVLQTGIRLRREGEGDLKLVGGILEGLQSIEKVDSTIQISGNMLRPRIRLRSTLGEQVAWAMNEAIRDYVAVKKKELLRSFESEVGESFQEVEKTWADGERHISALLSQAYGKLDQLKAKMAQAVPAGGGMLKGLSRFLQR